MTEPHASLLLDEMLSGTIAARLRDHGIDAIAVVEDALLISTPDEDLLVHATEHRRTLVTANITDFVALADDWRAAGHRHHGIVYLPHRTFPQDRSFVGAAVSSLRALCERNDVLVTSTGPGTEIFLHRAHR